MPRWMDAGDGVGCGLATPLPHESYINHPGGRGRAKVWYHELVEPAIHRGIPLVWCAFNAEQFRHIPSILSEDGFLVQPASRTPFVWGGEDGYKGRRHGELMKSPGDWTKWWTNVVPAYTPVASTVIRTGRQTVYSLPAADS